MPPKRGANSDSAGGHGARPFLYGSVSIELIGSTGSNMNAISNLFPLGKGVPMYCLPKRNMNSVFPDPPSLFLALRALESFGG